MPGEADKANAIEMGERLADAVNNSNQTILLRDLPPYLSYKFLQYSSY